jgi:aryl-alcohol dehydrogenase-like predicted oxidoreductase
MTAIPRIQLGRSDILVSRFILGAGGIGGVATVTGPGIGLDEEQGGALVDHALEVGINVIDTADVYAGGASERILGGWRARHLEADLLIETKAGMTPNGPDLSPGYLRGKLDRARKILGRVDLFLPHAVDPDTPWSESLPVLSEAVDQGLIRAYGLSNVTEADLAGALETADRLGLRRPQLIQNRYSLIARDDDAGVLPLARAESIGYTPYSPLAAGLLAGRYSDGEQPGHGSRLSTQAPTLKALTGRDVQEKVRRFNQVAQRSGLAPAALALAWLLNQPGVTAPIVGPSKPSHWDAITASLTVPWTSNLDQAVQEAFAD